MGLLLRTRSFNNLNNMIQDDDFKHIVPRGMKLAKIDAIRDTLKVIEIEGLRRMLMHGVRKARGNKVFASGTIDGLVVTGIDGTQTFNSDKKSCEHCLTASKKGRVEQRNFHSSVVLSTVGQGSKVVIDFEPYRAGMDVVVYDAIACNSEWFKTCIEAGVETVVRVKNNNIDSVREARKKVNKSDEVAVWMDIDGYENVKVYEENFNMDKVDKPFRFIKFLMKKPDGKRFQTMIVTTCVEMELKTLFKIIRARQDIENSIFHNLKTECGLEHCFVHGGNAVEAVLCLMFIASNIFQLFYHRRIKKSIKTQVELVRQMLKGLYLLKRNSALIFDSS